MLDWLFSLAEKTRVNRRSWQIGAWFFLVCAGVAGTQVSAASATTLSLSPAGGTYPVGSNFSVTVRLSSPDQAMNGTEGVVSFPADQLQVASLSRTGSMLTVWAQEPRFSNSDGTVQFEGGIPNPGFTGASANILTINFRVVAAGDAAVRFASASVLANDGLGTNIFTGTGSAEFILRPSAGAAPTVVPAAPKSRGESQPAVKQLPVEQKIVAPPTPSVATTAEETTPPAPPAATSRVRVATPFQSMWLFAFALCAVMGMVLWYAWHRFFRLRRRLRQEIHTTERNLHRACTALRDNMQKNIRLLERARTRRELTSEEEKIIQQLKTDIESVERLVGRELEQMEKETG